MAMRYQTEHNNALWDLYLVPDGDKKTLRTTSYTTSINNVKLLRHRYRNVLRDGDDMNAWVHDHLSEG
jgi:hypothetical protein